MKHSIKAGIAVLAFAGAGIVAPIAVAGSAQAASTTVNVVSRNIVTGNTHVLLQGVGVSTAAHSCGLKVPTLTQLLATRGRAFCPALSHNNTRVRVFTAS